MVESKRVEVGMGFAARNEEGRTCNAGDTHWDETPRALRLGMPKWHLASVWLVCRVRMRGRHESLTGAGVDTDVLVHGCTGGALVAASGMRASIRLDSTGMVSEEW